MPPIGALVRPSRHNHSADADSGVWSAHPGRRGDPAAFGGHPTGPTAVDRQDPVVDRVVFDLDPGDGAGLPACVDVAWALRERLGALGARTVPVTSGSKGIHVYVPLDEPITSGQASDWARLAAEQLERALPDLVVSTMAKTARRGTVLGHTPGQCY